MSDAPKTFVLINPTVRQNAMIAVRGAPDDYVVTIKAKTRSIDQNAKFHAICADLAASQVEWAGSRRTLDQWKALMISGHAVATGSAGDVIPGLEGEFVAIRESSARMGIGRAASLITYVLSFCDANGVDLHETSHGGFIEERAA